MFDNLLRYNFNRKIRLGRKAADSKKSRRSFQLLRAARGDKSRSPFDIGDPNHKLHRVEAVLLISREPLNTRQISKLANLTDGTEARTLIREIHRRYREKGRAFTVEKVAGGYQFLTKPQLSTWIRRLHGVKDEARLSDPSMETLAIIAYRQPVLRADIEQIRGVSCGEVLRQLMEKKFIKISGRSEELGRPFLYSTTKYFLKYFGLDKVEDLPKSDYFKKTTGYSTPVDPADPTDEDYT